MKGELGVRSALFLPKSKIPTETWFSILHSHSPSRVWRREKGENESSSFLAILEIDRVEIETHKSLHRRAKEWVGEWETKE